MTQAPPFLEPVVRTETCVSCCAQTSWHRLPESVHVPPAICASVRNALPCLPCKHGKEGDIDGDAIPPDLDPRSATLGRYHECQGNVH